jgi:hypothetical protein
MNMKTIRTAIFIMLLFIVEPRFTDIPVASANDSAAELATGGLVLRQSDVIIMESEDLFISPTEIRVSYQFKNPTSTDVKTVVAFPLPDVDYGLLAQDENLRVLPVSRDEAVFPFSTKVDGKPLQLHTEMKAFLGNTEVTDRLKALQIPLLLGADRTHFLKKVRELPSEVRKSLLDEKIIVNDTIDTELYLPLWRTHITIWREQTFPAKKMVTVDHTYSPITGGTVGNWREPHASDATIPEWYWKAYCIDDAFIAGVIKKIDRARSEGKELVTSDLWLSSILTSGANWSGPIKKFTLTIEKSSADTLVSLCESNVVKVSPTRFQVIKSNFTPSEDLRILFVNFSSF